MLLYNTKSVKILTISAICVPPSLTFDKMFSKLPLTKDAATQKIKHYCAYQERCHQEVKDKLYGFGLHSKEVNEIIAFLIEENYLNEERFAIHFAGGKFRTKQWGRKKIQYELQQKRISTYLIKLALKEIDAEQYTSVLHKLATTKWKSLKGQNKYTKMGKTNAYLVQKGYESVLVNEVIQSIYSSEKNTSS